MPISIVICAKNELNNLKAHLNTWVNQKYHDFEVIIVNDCSTDGSREWLDIQARKHSLLKIIHLENEDKILKGKRHALWNGIQAAKYDHLLFTDADCKANTDLWIVSMVSGFSATKEIVIGYSPYEKKPGLLNRMIQYDTLQTALQYLGWAGRGNPYMAVGRNVAYKKSLLTAKVFNASNKSISGDDDLIFQQVATKDNTATVLDKKSFTTSKSPTTYKEWIHQKTRHYGAGKHYPFSLKILLGLYSLSHLFYYLFAISFIIQQDIIAGIIFLFILPFLLRLLLNLRQYRTLNATQLILHTLYIDILYWLFYFVVLLLPLPRNYGWKLKKNR
ncbi:MAG: glycosyltransferase [Chitinophagales bacterium]